MESLHGLGTATDWVVMFVYFIGIMLFGSYFAKYNRNTNDFFFGGRRFAWWLITVSIVATGVGSHSFVKYAAKGLEHGVSSTMTYMNDWFFMPFFLFGWLPIVVYTKIKSIPEYFEKRFSPTVRLIATVFQLLYMIGYLGIGLLTLGKVFTPLLPASFDIFGLFIPVNLMGVIITIAAITGVYTTFGGQTAVIFTDLIQGVILLFAGFLIFLMGINYVGGLEAFWHLLPPDWRLPLADFNSPADFNFVGIFWQDGVAGSVGFLFMNMGLLMRFMSAKSVDEGRKAAVFNVLFMLPLSAIVVGNAGWIAKAILGMAKPALNADVNPDEVFIAVTHIIASKGVFGFVIAALTATLLSTVDSLINAIAAVYMNDVHPHVRKLYAKRVTTQEQTSKEELFVARISSIVITAVGILATIPFSKYPTVYQAHGYFHSTLTPPLVTAIFLGVFWKKFTPAGVLATFLGGSSLMILGATYPDILIAPIAHGTPFDPVHPYSYISALYNTIVCVAVGVLITLTLSWQKGIVNKIRKSASHEKLMRVFIGIIVASLIIIWINVLPLAISMIIVLVMTVLVSLTAQYYIHFDPNVHLDGLTAWSIHRAKEIFKGGKVNEREGEVITAHWRVRKDNEDYISVSKADMKKMEAEVGDLVYVCDKRKYLGGLKSFHSKYGEPHEENGVVYIGEEHRLSAQFQESKLVTVEKEM
ncbi:MAG: sodium:proline symporter [Stygiobacter sp. RIFOXYC12_FULL_38_8]|nr:MAG: sodium:proline symporter [Stygiobacter sp. RIFOXYA12_FULL_38_9]OGV07183.1 MAG: sodium:proline symporter [Stygiobacter sp. RIFOXYB2_FULL_37_11]OGV10395.1 MAG: sodium:proline symporter [Stygiobacter sp. RIFOXYA2_FULL_38_8]OGV14591.1 MAG: sodium:proline symporter [Stygiobacter sp. RIFOXYC2_FULL_38_25]OGV29298.1 MAG: sodium:proline symporter [Stygiobacter sp. RIFOXYC12_FULL_38_8]OGV81471.1 MAG: sodium:proline symporter [Stygiobacter sp. GWF2_38_21]